jgi:hypothetical protein
MNLKNLLLPALLLIGISVQAQFSKERERNIHLFKLEAHEIAMSKATTETKEARLSKLCSDYLSSMATLKADEQIAKFHKYDDCDQSKIKAYIKVFLNDNKKVLTRDYVSKQGKKDDCALNAAVNLYELLGPSNLASSDICGPGGCDKNTEKRMKSRGAKEQYWMYTGEKKYIVDEKVSGWRYKCVLVEDGPEHPMGIVTEDDSKSEEMEPEGEMKEETKGRNETKEDFEEPYTFENDYVIVPDVVPVWKKQELVDIWR